MDSLAVLLRNLYVFATIFGVGFLAIDLLGLFDAGDDSGDADETGADEAGGLLSALRYFRTLLYFCAGFGPAGLAAGFFGYGTSSCLGWGLGTGIAAALVARTLFRFQYQSLDSTVQQHELLAERAVVTVPILRGQMGKVRLRLGPVVVERYAMATDPHDTFEREEMVQIIEVLDDCVKVEKYHGSRYLDDNGWRDSG